MTLTAPQIARVCHEANRALQIEQGDPDIDVSPHWDHLDEETRQSAIVGVKGVLDGNTPEQSHETWLKFKIEHGWKYGPQKNPITKQHPCLVPYAELPAEQRLKDDLFASIVIILADVEENAQVDQRA